MSNDRDPTDVRDLERTEAQAADTKRRNYLRERNDLQTVMSTVQGRRFMWRQLERAGVFRTTFAGHDPKTNFNEGQRNIGVMLLADIHEHCIEQYVVMLTENRTSDDGSNDAA